MKKKKPILGLLSTISVELPYEDAKKQAEADKTNAEIAHLGFRTCRVADDWGFQKYSDLRTNILKKSDLAKPLPNTKTPLKSGDLVKVFKTVSDGDVHWNGVVDFDFTAYHHGLQKNLDAKKWTGMFYDQLPARLEREGKIIFGALDPFCETGTEGVIWSLHEYGKTGYDGLVVLKKDDKLCVYSKVRNGAVEWEGKMDFGPDKVEKLGWSEITRQTNHMDTQKWLELSWQRRPIVVVPK